MPPIPRPHGASPNLLEAIGRQVAATLIAGQPGDAEKDTGWRGGLQTAANLTADNQDVLQIADDIHQAAPDLTTHAGIRAYALSTTPGGTAATALSHCRVAVPLDVSCSSSR